MEKVTLSVKFDTTSLDEAIEKVRTLKKELRELALLHRQSSGWIPATTRRKSHQPVSRLKRLFL
ncbi:MAG: hypothetical protein E6314_00030 [Enterobacter sp.]|nr:hypothetical protein [Enterobacter sp.]MDU7181419.1 hypothetical protein [Enterobacter roggenkampii]